MNTNLTSDRVVKRKRGRPRSLPEVASDQAAAYGISVPVLSETGERFLSPNEIGKVLNVSGEAVKQWIYRRKLPAVKLANGFWKVKVSDFEGFLKARTEVGRRHVLITNGIGVELTAILDAIQTLNLQPVLTHNYADALLKALDHFPALFVICISPDDSECWKFAAKIRSNKGLRSFPILFIGGTTISDQETERAVSLSAKGILSRPLNVDVLAKEIERIIQRTA